MSDHEHSHAPSSKSLFLILISTFLFGFLTGVIVFLQNNTGGEGDGSGTVTKKGFEILAYTYGGCERLGCPSYRIANDGTYQYFPRGRKNEDSKFESELSDDALDALKKEIKGVVFENVQSTKFNGTCPIVSDGIAFQYEIIYNGEPYRFDSCVENLSGVPFFKSLLTHFENFENEERRSRE